MGIEDFPSRERYEAFIDPSHEIQEDEEIADSWRKVLSRLQRGYEELTVDDWRDIRLSIEDLNPSDDSKPDHQVMDVLSDWSFTAEVVEEAISAVDQEVDFWDWEVQRWEDVFSGLPDYDDLTPTDWQDLIHEGYSRQLYGFDEYIEGIEGVF